MNCYQNTIMLLSCLVSIPYAGATTVVYQDDFDNDGLGTNAGIGGGLTSLIAENGGVFVENGELDFDASNSTPTRAAVASTNSFSVTNGFTLEFTYTISSFATNGNNNSNTVNIGLISDSTVISDNAGGDIFSDNRDVYGIGLNFTDVGTAPVGLNFSNNAGSGSVTNLTNTPDLEGIGTGTHTVTLTVDAASNFSYSIDGGAVTTGTIAGGFDFSEDYQFYAFARNDVNELEIASVTLTAAIPEPGSLMLLGIGAFVFGCRRKR